MNVIQKSKKRAFVPIVGDGAIATTSWADGRLIPVLIVDCENRSDLSDIIKSHSELPPGDVTIRWAKHIFKKKEVYLLIEFSKPSVVDVFLAFNIEKQGVLVDAILMANALYLQSLDAGKKVIDGINKRKILIEIPDTGYYSEWDKLYTSALIRKFKKNGFRKPEAKIAAEQHKNKVRELWQTRMNA